MVAILSEPVSPTPVSSVTVRLRGRTHHLLLKHECHGPTGSVKDRTAVGLLRALDEAAPLHPGTTIVESSSGNLGVALARLTAQLGCRLIVVTDLKTPEATRHRLRTMGARVDVAEEPDRHGGYLLTRLRFVRELCRANPSYRWTDQYSNPANPLIHERTTGPEIVRQGGPGLDTVYVAVSTGGTLAGIAAHVRSLGRPIRLVAVDARDSYTVKSRYQPDLGRIPPVRSSRLVPGIGSSLRSSFLTPGSFDRDIAVDDADGIAMCHIFRADTGIALGGSSGHVLTACMAELDSPTPPERPLCLTADDGEKYENTIYDNTWLAGVDLVDGVALSIDRYRGAGLTFHLGGERPAGQGQPSTKS